MRSSVQFGFQNFTLFMLRRAFHICPRCHKLEHDEWKWRMIPRGTTPPGRPKNENDRSAGAPHRRQGGFASPRTGRSGSQAPHWKKEGRQGTNNYNWWSHTPMGLQLSIALFLYVHFRVGSTSLSFTSISPHYWCKAGGHVPHSRVALRIPSFLCGFLSSDWSAHVL